ncbi:hypothetical protein CKO12_04480 [Chromatium okenii]|uniref:exo-beta-N-acetylmuramidase NamZ family protein n=1 Tax=Chromatium okenii TaxID=61644 RepID=UPI0019081462|nr:DUF1343 domain-containing protein [Chromatium okenii]MBK1641140.1 hypothetical protein [Chromatium okenii]
MITLGIDRILEEPTLRQQLRGRRLALLGHSASMTRSGQHSLDALMAFNDLNIVAAFGPQHGMRGDQQDNMQETPDAFDAQHGIPVYSLYGTVRYPTPAMLDCFDVLLVDLQDIGTRIYTYVTTLCYFIEACAANHKALWVLDRPNPIGRPLEGTLLEPGWESFVGIGPLLMRHGLTLGELAQWFINERQLSLEFQVIQMREYFPAAAPGFGWPIHQLAWVNPSPNASSLNMARCFPGTVLLEGTTLSEGRGTTTALELVGAPDLDIGRIIRRMEKTNCDWMTGALIRPCWFKPTFHKYANQLCAGLQIHTDCAAYQHHHFKPYRFMALFFKSVRLEYPDYPLWRNFHYEYETERLAIDLLTGSAFLREWVDTDDSGIGDLEQHLIRDEQQWAAISIPLHIY